MGDFFGDRKSVDKFDRKKVKDAKREIRERGGSALRTNTPNGNDRALTRLEALHYRAEGTVADIHICARAAARRCDATYIFMMRQLR